MIHVMCVDVVLHVSLYSNNKGVITVEVEIKHVKCEEHHYNNGTGLPLLDLHTKT